jgi:hypothetical protein
MLNAGEVSLAQLKQRVIRVGGLVRGTVPEDERRQMVLSLILARLADCLEFLELC